MTKDELVIVDDPTAVLSQHRKQTAGNKETQALLAEVTAKQYEFVATMKTSGSSMAQGSQTQKEYAKKARSEADAMHKLAETKPEMFAPNVVANLESQEFSFQQQLLGARDAAAHPEAYGNVTDQLPPEYWEEGIRVIREMITGLKGGGK